MPISENENVNGAVGSLSSPRKDLYRLIPALVAVGFIMLLNLNQAPPTEQRERRIFNVITGMIATGDYLTPRIRGTPHLTKPPMYYWLGAAAEKVTGLPERIGYRLPTMISAIALILSVFWLCRVVELPDLALPASLILTACYEFYGNARLADFDMMLAASTLSGVAAFQKYLLTNRPRWLGCASALWTIALLTKATPAIPILLIPSAAFAFAGGRWKAAVRPPAILICLLLPVLLCLSWYLIMLKTIPRAGEIFRNESLLPFGVKGERPTAAHFQPPYFFFYKILKIAFPAIVLLPLALVRSASTKFLRNEAWGVRGALYSFAGLFLLFSIFPQKQEAYLLPSLPSLAILFADAITQMMPEDLFRRVICALGGLAALIFVGLSAVVWFYFYVILESPLAAVLAVAVCLIFTVLLAAEWWRGKARAVLVTALIGWWFAIGGYYTNFAVLQDQFKASEISERPGYSKKHWETLYARYPRLREIFKTSERLQKDDAEY